LPITWRRRDAAERRLILLGLVVPYWVNEILRAFSLRLLLTTKGLINNLWSRPADRHADRLPGNNVGLYVGLSMLPAGDDLSALQCDREPGPESDRGGARSGAPWCASTRTWSFPCQPASVRLHMVFMFSAGGWRRRNSSAHAHLWFTSGDHIFFQVQLPAVRLFFICWRACIALVMVNTRLFKVPLGEPLKMKSSIHKACSALHLLFFAYLFGRSLMAVTAFNPAELSQRIDRKLYAELVVKL